MQTFNLVCARVASRVALGLLVIASAGFSHAQTIPPGPSGVNDPYAIKQWNLTAINAPQAWSLLAANTNKVRVAIIDSDNSAHPDVLWATDGANAQLVRTKIGYGHGTHVAGIIAGRSNNAQGIAGICKQCEILPVVLSSNSDQALAEAIKLAVRLDAQVINLSLELRVNVNGTLVNENCSASGFQLTRMAIEKAIDAGVTVVAAAGNYGASFDKTASPTRKSVQQITPASCPGVISVGATDQTAKVSTYTNSGPTLMAPGGGASQDGAYGAGVGCSLTVENINQQVATSTVGILSTWSEDKPGGSRCYRYLSGTSMATPHVTGVVGMMLAANPALAPNQIKQILETKANNTTVANCTDCGAGLVDAFKAVNVALGTRGAAVPYAGVCRFALGETCKIDTIDELPNGTISVTAYGKRWNYSASGMLIGKSELLTNVPVYIRAEGPCGVKNRPETGLCGFETRTVVDYPGAGILDSVTVRFNQVQKYWNYYVATGAPLGPEGGSASQVQRYSAACPWIYEAAYKCTFDTRTLVNFAEWGGVVESLTTSDGRYLNFDGAGRKLAGVSGEGYLTNVARYRVICDSNATCRFDARELKSNRNEVIIAYGKYFEYSGEQLIKSFYLDQSPSPFR